MVTAASRPRTALILALPESAVVMAGPVGVTWKDGTTVIADVHAAVFAGPEAVTRRLEAFDDVLDALAEVLRYDAPCDHAPDPESCTHCRARALIARYSRTTQEADHD